MWYLITFISNFNIYSVWGIRCAYTGRKVLLHSDQFLFTYENIIGLGPFEIVHLDCHRWAFSISLLGTGIFFFRVRAELTCWADSRLCHWATGRRGLDNMSAQCLSWFPMASQPRKIFPMGSFLVTASWSQTEITRCTLWGQHSLSDWQLKQVCAVLPLSFDPAMIDLGRLSITLKYLWILLDFLTSHHSDFISPGISFSLCAFSKLFSKSLQLWLYMQARVYFLHFKSVLLCLYLHLQ